MDLKPIINTTIENIKDTTNSKDVLDAVCVVITTLEKENRRELILDFVKGFNDALQSSNSNNITVHTPLSLSKELINKLEVKAKKHFNIIDVKVNIEQVIDTNIIGGLLIKFNDEELNLTTNQKIQVIKRSI